MRAIKALLYGVIAGIITAIILAIASSFIVLSINAGLCSFAIGFLTFLAVLVDSRA